MKVEIENVIEIKEIKTKSNGDIQFSFPNHPNYIVKIVLVDRQRDEFVHTIAHEVSPDHSTTSINPSFHDMNYIDGTRHQKGLPRSRATSKEFSKLILSSFKAVQKTSSWLYLPDGRQLRYSNSVVYEIDNGYKLWYSFSADDLINHLKKGDVTLVFIIRDSKRIIFIDAREIIDDIQKSKQLRNNNDWIHCNLLFTDGELKIILKTGKNNQPIIHEVSKENHYVTWDRFINILGESD